MSYKHVSVQPIHCRSDGSFVVSNEVTIETENKPRVNMRNSFDWSGASICNSKPQVEIVTNKQIALSCIAPQRHL